jgi:hypothetical protein
MVDQDAIEKVSVAFSEGIKLVGGNEQYVELVKGAMGLFGAELAGHVESGELVHIVLPVAVLFDEGPIPGAAAFIGDGLVLAWWDTAEEISVSAPYQLSALSDIATSQRAWSEVPDELDVVSFSASDDEWIELGCYSFLCGANFTFILSTALTGAMTFTHHEPAPVDARATLRVEGTTQLSPDDVHEIVCEAIRTTKPGANYAGSALRLAIEGGPEGATIRMRAKAGFVCDFGFHAVTDGTLTQLRVGGLRHFKTKRHTVLFVPVKTEILGYGFYKRFLDAVLNAVLDADFDATVDLISDEGE